MNEYYEEWLNTILKSKDNKDDSYISIYNLCTIMYNTYQKYMNIDYKWDEELNSRVKDICIAYFLHSDNTMCVSKEINPGNYIYSTYIKKDGKLVLISSTYLQASKYILNTVGDILLTIYDEYISLEDFGKFKETITHNNYLITKIGNSDLVIYPFDNTFSIEYTYFINKYQIHCNDENIINILKGHEEEIMKNQFVKISDCPLFLQDELITIRKEELEKGIERKRIQLVY